MLKKSIREMEREIAANEREQKKTEMEIKKMAKKGEMNAVKLMARDLVRTKRFQTKLIQMKVNIQGINMKMLTMKSSQEMMSAMKNVGQAMGRMNAQMNLPKMQQMMMDFAKENEMMDMQQEMMGDAIDGVMEDEGDEEEEAEVVSKVLAEIGLDMDGKLGEAPTTAPGQAQAEAAPEVKDSGVSELESRLENLKR